MTTFAHNRWTLFLVCALLATGGSVYAQEHDPIHQEQPAAEKHDQMHAHQGHRPHTQRQRSRSSSQQDTKSMPMQHDQQMHGQAMQHGTGHGMDMMMHSVAGVPDTREGSGTAWQPD